MENKRSHIFGKSTFFAPAEREDEETVKKQRELIEGSEFLKNVMSRTPWMFVILNDKRQIVFSNAQMVNYLGYESLEKIVGLRPGETMGCTHVKEGPGGCGTSVKCSYCGIVHSILKSKAQNDVVTEDAIIVYELEGKKQQNEFRVTSLPFEWSGENMVMLTFHDISSEKRKEQLERIFFHDILNKAGTITQMLTLLKEREPDISDNHVFELLERGVDEFVQDVVYQQKLQQAEDGKLLVSLIEVPVSYLIKTVIEDYSVQTLMKGVKIVPDLPEEEQYIITDVVLLRRILGNLVKNALEASKQNDEITLHFEKRDAGSQFTVHNPSVIPEHIRSQIFTRSVTTKGIGRGLGTYSIRLFTEQFLMGKASFTSEEGSGTTFFISLPA